MKLQLEKYVILDEQGDLVGTAESLIGCCRQLARASTFDLSWNDVRELLVDADDGIKTVELFISGVDRVSRFEITTKDDVEPKEFIPEHNHMTRDVKRYGLCPGCDEHHDRYNETDC